MKMLLVFLLISTLAWPVLAATEGPEGVAGGEPPAAQETKAPLPAGPETEESAQEAAPEERPESGEGERLFNTFAERLDAYDRLENTCQYVHPDHTDIRAACDRLLKGLREELLELQNRLQHFDRTPSTTN